MNERRPVVVRPVRHHRRGARGRDEGFFLRITGIGDYRYEGADLGILIAPTQLMERGELTERARAWIAGLRGEYLGVPLAASEPSHSLPIEIGQFKIF